MNPLKAQPGLKDKNLFAYLKEKRIDVVVLTSTVLIDSNSEFNRDFFSIWLSFRSDIIILVIDKKTKRIFQKKSRNKNCRF